MCIACGSQWPPWTQRVHVAPAPTKEETIYIDENTAFYPDYRTGIHPPGPVYQGTGAAAVAGMYGQGMYGAGGYGGGMYPMQGMCPGMNGYPAPTMCNYQVPGFGAQQYPYSQFGWPYTHSSLLGSIYTSMPYSSFNTLFSSEPPHLLHYPTYDNGNTYSPLLLTAGNNMAPGQFPFATSPTELTAQAAAVAEHNKQLSSMPNAMPYMVGANPAEIAAQQAMLAQQMQMQTQMGAGMMPHMTPGMMPGMMGGMAGGMMGGQMPPNTVAPYKPGEANQFWCRETNGAWSLRNYSEICLGEVSPGHWEKHALSGYFFWVKHLS